MVVLFLFKFVLPSAKLWRNVIEATSELIDEANFIAKPDGVSLRSMDPSHVAMIEVVLPVSFFDEYICDVEVNIGVNLDELKRLLRRAGANDRLEMEILDPSRLTIKFIGRAHRTFNMPLIDISAEDIPAPSLDFNVYARLISDVLSDAVKDAAIVSDYVKLLLKMIF